MDYKQLSGCVVGVLTWHTADPGPGADDGWQLEPECTTHHPLVSTTELCDWSIVTILSCDWSIVTILIPDWLQVIEGLGQHGMVGSADQSLINLHDGLRQVSKEIEDERFM